MSSHGFTWSEKWRRRCPACFGRGRVWDWYWLRKVKCPTCGGKGIR